MPLALTRAEDFHKQNRAETHDFAPQNRGFGYQPALDGVRAIAVAMVLVFHAGYRWMSGGYVGVSVFFTLSGFLITSLALVEHDRSGRLDAGAFYARRVRRLLPASLVCLLGVMVAAWAGQFHGVTNLRRDLWGALAQVYNWVALAGRGSYAQQMARAAGQRAPLDHYWSLSIEEQFYWVWPLVLIVVLRWSAPRRVAAVAGLTAACTVAAVVIAVAAGPDAAYYATPARLPEILAGALLAVGVHAAPRWRVPCVVGAGRRGGRRRRWSAIVTVAVVWPADGGPATAGWMPAFAVASVVLIGALQVRSPVRGLLSIGPLVALGRISYGVYLFHWPIYTLVDERRVHGRAHRAVRAAGGAHPRRGDRLLPPPGTAAAPRVAPGAGRAGVRRRGVPGGGGARAAGARPPGHLRLPRREHASGGGDPAGRPADPAGAAGATPAARARARRLHRATPPARGSSSGPPNIPTSPR